MGLAAAAAVAAVGVAGAGGPRCVSGVYPHLAVFNEGAECGIGAVAPWAGRLWFLTYPPHKPAGSDDKLYELAPDLARAVARPESVGGTHANRFLHTESAQLLIGPYAIDRWGRVRTIPVERLFGRLTGVARHLTDPARKVVYATMEEGFYEVDVRTLEVTRLWADTQAPDGPRAQLPGYHGKGLASGQGRLVYANNGENSPEALRRPDIPSGSLCEWDGTSSTWTVVRRNQFTEVTGPGGLRGNRRPSTDPIWSIGWDHRSLLLMVLDAGRWHAYRLPKASHCYDGAHGWNTEWPRIREIGERDLLMTMHGMLWRFPRGFRPSRSAGIVPRSTYLKVVADFCRWGDRIVFGCDDAAANEFLNKRSAKGDLAPPGQSQSNLWFVEPERLDRLGPPMGRGAVWLDEPVRAGVPSDPFLFAGFQRRGLHLTHAGSTPIVFRIEVDRRGNGAWGLLRTVTVPARGYVWVSFDWRERGAWVRLVAERDGPGVTAMFHCSSEDRRPAANGSAFAGLAALGDREALGGLLRAKGERSGLLQMSAVVGRDGVAHDGAYYEMGADLRLRQVEDRRAHAWMRRHVAIPSQSVTEDDASVLVVDDEGRRWRLPKGAEPASHPLGRGRADREVCTERDLFCAGGTFYELPAENAGGFARIRPIATHLLALHDYCSYRGMLVMTGVRPDAPASDRIVRSEDGRAALWVGVVDDLWQLGKPRGRGGPWRDTPVSAGVASDPYLMSGYDRKSLRLSHRSPDPLTIAIEVDITGGGLWRTWEEIEAPPGAVVERRFPDGFSAYWVRFRASRDATVTAELIYD